MDADRPDSPAPVAWLATPPGKGGIAVLTLSGDRAEDVLAAVFRPRPAHAATGPDVLRLGHLLDARGVIDEAIVCSRGREVEINIHGGPLAARAALEALARCGARVVPSRPAATESFPLAHPRWGNPAVGRELLEALPAARGPLALAALTRQWAGGLSALAAAAPDPAALRRAADALPAMRRLLAPAEVVLAGPPNAGKSSLANALAGRDISIVHDAPGTTRDWVRELALMDGVPVWLTDTAGVWDPPEGVDAEAVRRARQRVAGADLVLLLEPAGEHFAAPDWLEATRRIRVASKCDLHPPGAGAGLAVSAASGAGLDRLRRAIVRELGLDRLDPAEAMAFTPRQAELLAIAAAAAERGDPAAARAALRALLAG